MSRIFWDTNLFIYLIQSTTSLGRRTRELAWRMRERQDALYASTMTLGEVLVEPLREGKADLVSTYENLFSRRVTMVPFDRESARQYAMIRRDRGIRPPDAIQLACAAQAGADFFITNDEKLGKKQIAGIQYITTLDRVPI